MRFVGRVGLHLHLRAIRGSSGRWGPFSLISDVNVVFEPDGVMFADEGSHLTGVELDIDFVILDSSIPQVQDTVIGFDDVPGEGDQLWDSLTLELGFLEFAIEGSGVSDTGFGPFFLFQEGIGPWQGGGRRNRGGSLIYSLCETTPTEEEERSAPRSATTTTTEESSRV